MKNFTIILLTFVLVACSSNDNEQVQPGELDYSDINSVNVSKAFIEIDNEDAKSRSKGSISYLLKDDPADIVAEVISRKINSNGDDGMLRATVSKADIYSTSELVEGGSIFVDDQQVYVSEIEIIFKLFDGVELLPKKQNKVYARKKVGISKNANADEMQAFLNEAAQSIVEDTNILIEKASKENFPEIVIP